jgi:hypothetical protein
MITYFLGKNAEIKNSMRYFMSIGCHWCAIAAKFGRSAIADK